MLLRMLLHTRFKDEAEFREKFVKPLLNRLGFYGVSEQHGSQEFGKDFVFSELHRLGGMRHYAAQVKHVERINQGRAVDELLSQVKQAFAAPFKRPDSPRDCHVSAVYVFNSGEITANAKEQLLREVERERYGDNMHLLDGERLEALNEWATLQSDATARTRLVGLRSALYFIIVNLSSYETLNRADIKPLFIQGIELYLSEPVNCDDQMLVSLYDLWQHLQGVEFIRKTLLKSQTDTVRFQDFPNAKQLLTDARQLANEMSRKVDVAIEKLSPL